MSLSDSLKDAKQQQEIQKAYQEYQLRGLHDFLLDTLNIMLDGRLNEIELAGENASKLVVQFEGYKLCAEDLFWRLFNKEFVMFADEDKDSVELIEDIKRIPF